MEISMNGFVIEQISLGKTISFKVRYLEDDKIYLVTNCHVVSSTGNKAICYKGNISITVDNILRELSVLLWRNMNDNHCVIVYNE